MADDEKNIEETTEEPTAVEEETTAPEAEEVSDTTQTVEETPTAEEVSDTTDAPAEPAAEAETAEAPAAPAKKQQSLKHVPRSARRTRTKTVREKPATRKSITRLPKPGSELGRRQERR